MPRWPAASSVMRSRGPYSCSDDPLCMSVSAQEVEIRCPVPQARPDGTCHPGKLLLKMRQAGLKESYVHPDNHVEISCEDCKHRMRRDGMQVRRVLHRFDFAGELVTTLFEL